jgi:aerobic carbon-monoxide dehydrogenase small subunit
MITLRVNGRTRSFEGPPFKRLLDVLREDLNLTGTKEGCGEGECGACTVLVQGAAVNSCLIPVCQVDGQRIDTVEGLGKPGALNPLQQAFLREGGAQCGICTPGMLMTAWAYVKGGGSPAPDAIREQLAGNLCRCTGYQDIVDSVIDAIRTRGRQEAARARPARRKKRMPPARKRKVGKPVPRKRVKRPRKPAPKRVKKPRKPARKKRAVTRHR